ncbi:hypothetical protein [Vibrio mangrovi]|uniref:Uncharacterized protein n=1 Tax=Vibrio mangrovi TaxID=474394 RepID=A0A1Y6ITL2_9VIBR|nr:hypothetical protein [Vibrio mangrovi]MDW6004704.1 hypothetical protein [Vibrio mangrovi]SMS00995.1 hypothetical protein VIM7927_02272 [Vibrio mangrovi]
MTITSTQATCMMQDFRACHPIPDIRVLPRSPVADGNPSQTLSVTHS